MTEVSLQDYMELMEDIKEAIRPYLIEKAEEGTLDQAATAAVQALMENGAIEFGD